MTLTIIFIINLTSFQNFWSNAKLEDQLAVKYKSPQFRYAKIALLIHHIFLLFSYVLTLSSRKTISMTYLDLLPILSPTICIQYAQSLDIYDILAFLIIFSYRPVPPCTPTYSHHDKTFTLKQRHTNHTSCHTYWTLRSPTVCHIHSSLYFFYHFYALYRFGPQEFAWGLCVWRCSFPFSLH
jgi:hypothetical protein